MRIRNINGFTARSGWLTHRVAAAVIGVGLIMASMSAQAVTLNKTGWGNLTAAGGTSSCCYNVGYNNAFGPEYRDYFTFNLSSITAGTTIYGATLNIKESGYSSATSSVTFDVGSYGSLVSYLNTGNGTDTITAFNALGSGTLFGSVVDTSANNGQIIQIVLDAAALSALEAAEGSGTFVIGGYTTGVPNTAANSIFQSSGSGGSVSLTLDTVPEPASLTLLGVGLAGLGLRRRTRRGS